MSGVSHLLVERAFRDAFELGRSIAASATEWDCDYTLKEVVDTIRILTEKVELHDVDQRYALGLRLHALSLLFVKKLLEADARGEFDNDGRCVHNAATAYEFRSRTHGVMAGIDPTTVKLGEGDGYWCRECQSNVERSANGWIKK